MTKYQFTCPKCGSHDLEEILTDVTLTSQIITIEEPLNKHSSAQLSYSPDVQHEGGRFCRFQCADCASALVDEDGHYLEEDDLIDSKYLQVIPEDEEDEDSVVVTHQELVRDELLPRLAQSYNGMTGEELEELWNEQFPGDPVKYLGDDLFEWQQDLDESNLNKP